MIVSKNPSKIKMNPAVFCIAIPNFLLLLISVPFSPTNDMIPAKISTGIDVPIANTEGKTAPIDELRTIGINIKKNKENIVGQKAAEKLTPIKKEPVLPLPVHEGSKEVNLFINLNVKKPIRDNPIRMNNGPISFLNKEKASGMIS